PRTCAVVGGAWGRPGRAPRLWVRWYKLSSTLKADSWLKELAKRSPPPLAVVGGDISDRAVSQGESLRRLRGQWRGRDPLFLITTATADQYNVTGAPNQDPTLHRWPALIDVYAGRSFRFSFSNQQMAEAVLDFVRHHPQVWPPQPGPAAARAAAVGVGDSLGGLAVSLLPPHVLHTLDWSDDKYSPDLALRFSNTFREHFRAGVTDPYSIPY